jgi:hypothetical protein
MTARAHAPELARQSRALSRMAGATVDERDQALVAWGKDLGGAPDLRARIVRLGRGWAPAPRARRWRRYALAGVAIAAVGGVAVAVARAVDYHATYEARIKPATERTDGQGK